MDITVSLELDNICGLMEKVELDKNDPGGEHE